MESIYFQLKTEFSNDLSQKCFCSVLLLWFNYVSTMSVIFFSVVLRFTFTFNHTHSHPLRQSLSLHLQLSCFALPLSNCLTSSNIESFEILNNYHIGKSILVAFALSKKSLNIYSLII